MSQSRSDENQNEKLSVAQSLFSGSVAGALEVLANHPFWTIKTRVQKKEDFTLNPRVLYRGILASAASEVPITAIQLGLNRGLQLYAFGDQKDLSASQRLASAFTAGVGSAFISCPTEMVITAQGTLESNFYTAGLQVFQQRGFKGFYTSLPATGMREGLFTAFFLGVTPLVKTWLRPYSTNENSLHIFSGVISGVAATVVSQLFDTVKTDQQTVGLNQPVNFNSSVKKIYRESGVLGFFKGGLARGARVASAVTLMSWVTDSLEEPIRSYNAKNK